MIVEINISRQIKYKMRFKKYFKVLRKPSIYSSGLQIQSSVMNSPSKDLQEILGYTKSLECEYTLIKFCLQLIKTLITL